MTDANIKDLQWKLTDPRIERHAFGFNVTSPMSQIEYTIHIGPRLSPSKYAVVVDPHPFGSDNEAIDAILRRILGGHSVYETDDAEKMKAAMSQFASAERN